VKTLKGLGILVFFALLIAGFLYLFRYTVLGKIWYWIAIASIVLPFLGAMFAGTLELNDSNQIKNFLWIPIGIVLIYGIVILVWFIFRGSKIVDAPAVVFMFLLAFIIWLKLRTLMVVLNLLNLYILIFAINKQGSLISIILMLLLVAWSTVLVFKYRKYRRLEKQYTENNPK